ncbi:MAG: redoxin domain-containing protein [Pirellulaceae bacterium]|nr:redoxin domain-containing protein [Pirellulaceae bacterium]
MLRVMSLAASLFWIAFGSLMMGAERLPVGDFTLPDFRGKDQRLAELKDKSLVVVAFLGTECPLAKLYGPRLAKLSKEYESRGVGFLGINPNQQDSLTEMAAYARQHGIEFPLLKDLENKVADRFGAKRTPEVFVLDRQRVIRYQGRVDDQWGIGYIKDEPKSSELKAALDELLAGKQVSLAKTEAVGCLIGRTRKPETDSRVTYSSHIAALFQKRCVECHRTGEIGPFTLSSYEEAVGWAGMIEEVVDEGRMPPWHASPKYGHFSEERRLSDEEKSLIHQWVAAGAPAGDLSQLPKAVEYPTGWQIAGEPDMRIKMRKVPFEVPATGEVKYQFFQVDPGFTEDKWVYASEVKPDNRAVVHHILVFARGGAGGLSTETLRDGAGGGFVAGYVPGLRAKPYPHGMAKRIPADAKLLFQVHYTTNGSPQVDNSELALWFADPKTITQEVKTIANASRRLVIPPYDSNYETEITTAALPSDALLLSFSPHMHLRGKDFRYDVILPGKQEETLLDVPHYDFSWQTTYRLAEPMKLPAGTKMHSVAHFDNSANNLSNPDPSKTVTWGDQTWDEMMIGYFDLAIPRANADKISESGQAPANATATNRRSLADGAQLDGKAIMEMLDVNHDGKISKEEAPQRLQAVFDRLDGNKSGDLTAGELKDLPSRRKK